MSAHVLLNLLNELRKRDKMQGQPQNPDFTHDRSKQRLWPKMRALAPLSSCTYLFE